MAGIKYRAEAVIVYSGGKTLFRLADDVQQRLLTKRGFRFVRWADVKNAKMDLKWDADIRAAFLAVPFGLDERNTLEAAWRKIRTGKF